jgi:hypothetical protein
MEDKLTTKIKKPAGEQAKVAIWEWGNMTYRRKNLERLC